MAIAASPLPAALADGSEPIARSDVEYVLLVNDRDEPVGTAEKLDAHRGEGALHRAFSVFLFDDRGRMLIQRRAAGKYHFASLWTNACCSHPRPGEPVAAAARRRLAEELGLRADLVPLFPLLYSASDPRSGLVEREFDHVFAGRTTDRPRPCPSEVGAVAWCEVGELQRDCQERPGRYTPWFRLALRELEARGHLRVWGAPASP